MLKCVYFFGIYPQIILIEQHIFINRIALAKQGDNVLGSFCPSVCPSVWNKEQRRVIISRGCLSLC